MSFRSRAENKRHCIARSPLGLSLGLAARGERRIEQAQGVVVGHRLVIEGPGQPGAVDSVVVGAQCFAFIRNAPGKPLASAMGRNGRASLHKVVV